MQYSNTNTCIMQYSNTNTCIMQYSFTNTCIIQYSNTNTCTCKSSSLIQAAIITTLYQQELIQLMILESSPIITKYAVVMTTTENLLKYLRSCIWYCKKQIPITIIYLFYHRHHKSYLISIFVERLHLQTQEPSSHDNQFTRQHHCVYICIVFYLFMLYV